MINLLIDIGNSDVKTGKCKPYFNSPDDLNRIKLLSRYSYSKDNFEKEFEDNFKSLLQQNKINRVNKIGISQLQNTNEKFLIAFFKNKIGLIPEFADRDLVHQIKINYKKGLGNDRICNAAASDALFFNKKNILIIDFGTATTYTLILNKTLTGGLISPGIRTSLNSLISSTSLPEIKLEFPVNIINDNTSDNIKSGVMFQSLFAVERIITELKRMHKNLFVVVTGGNSELIFKKTNLIDIIDKNLVLKGINVIISG